MNPLVLSVADGTVFFVGLVTVLAAEAMLFPFRDQLARTFLTVVAAAGMILVVISATPLPVWAYAIWTIAALTGIVLLNTATLSWRRCLVCGTVLLASTVALCVAEARFRRCPALRVPDGATVYVLGDSISAGIGTDQRCWPAVLDERTPFRVVNLAEPGATVESAAAQAKGIAEAQSVVIVEIGGNDLLRGTDVNALRSAFDALVSSLTSDGHDVLVLELPLFPFQNGYGKAQRDVVRKYGVAMLPKRFFARVLGTEGGTVDGLHLSQAGHDAMASIIADVLSED